jgi:hypothetical protein
VVIQKAESVLDARNMTIFQIFCIIAKLGDMSMKTAAKNTKKNGIIKIAEPTEREHHNKVIAWARLMVETGQEPLLHFLRSGFEGLRLTMGVRMQVKRQSIATGWPDLFLAVPKWDRTAPHVSVSGLFIELKRIKGGTVSAEQARMIGDLNSLGYKAVVCKGAAAAIREIKNYLGMP